MSFLKFVHKPITKKKFEALEVVLQLRSLAKCLVPTSMSREPKGSKFNHLPSYEDLLHRFLKHCENAPGEPNCLKQVIPAYGVGFRRERDEVATFGCTPPPPPPKVAESRQSNFAAERKMV